MSRRLRVPAADELFRPTVVLHDQPPQSDKSDGPPPPKPAASRTPSGRVQHDEKMTVYVTGDEMVDIEHARLTLRRHHGLAVDRGRLVREAVALALADLAANGNDSAIVKRLLQR